MVEIQNADFTPEQNEVLDDVADLVREDRRKRFKVGGRTQNPKGTIGFHKMNVRQLRRIARDPHYKLVRPVYLRLIGIAEDIIFDYEAEREEQAEA